MFWTIPAPRVVLLVHYRWRVLREVCEGSTNYFFLRRSTLPILDLAMGKTGKFLRWTQMRLLPDGGPALFVVCRSSYSRLVPMFVATIPSWTAHEFKILFSCDHEFKARLAAEIDRAMQADFLDPTMVQAVSAKMTLT